MTLDHSGSSGHRLEQFSGLAPHRVHPGAPVSEQLPGLLGILTLVDALKHQPHLVSHACHTPFQGHRLPLLGFLFRSVHPVLEPHPTRPFQPVPLPGVGPALRLPNLVARLHHILDNVELVVDHPGIPEVVDNALGVGGTHVDGHVLDRLRMPVVSQQFPSKSLPNRGVLTGRREENPHGHKISKHRQIIVTLAPVHLVGSHPHHGVETQLLIRRLHVGEEHPPHPRVALAEDLAGTLHGHLTHQGHGEGLELLGEVLAATLPGRGDSIDLAIVATASSRQRTDDHALLVEDVEMPPLHRLDMVVSGHLRPRPGAFLRPQLAALLCPQDERPGTGFEPRFHNSLRLPKPQQLSKCLLGCHRAESSCGRQAPRFPIETTRNRILVPMSQLLSRLNVLSPWENRLVFTDEYRFKKIAIIPLEVLRLAQFMVIEPAA